MDDNILSASIADLKPDQNNANMHDEYGMSLLEDSLRTNGFGKSVLLAKDNSIIAGNGVIEKAVDLGMENVKIIDTDGTEVIALRRVDIEPNTDKFFNMALADNIVSKRNIVLNADTVEAIAESYNVERWAKVELGVPEGLTDEKTNVSFSEAVNFTVKCKNKRQLLQLQKKLGISEKSMSCDDFLRVLSGKV